MPDNIKVTNGFIELLGQGVLQNFMRKELPARLAYHLSLVFKKLQPELEALNDTRQAVIKKYAELNDAGEIKVAEDGRTIVWKEGCSQKNVIDEMAGILRDEVELDIEKLQVDMGTVPMVAMSDMNILSEFIEAA